MPMILLTVPPETPRDKCGLASGKIQNALHAEGVEGSITVWPVALVWFPGRLWLGYFSRQEAPDSNRLAQVAAEAAEKVFSMDVEAVTIKLDSKTTGLHITREH